MNVTWQRVRVELARKGIHMCTGLVPLSYATWLGKPWVVGLLGTFSAVMIAVEIARRRDGFIGRMFRQFFGFMLRKRERDGAKWLGATPYCLASLACVLVLPKEVAVLSLLFLAVGDTVASLVGLAWGRRRIGEKSIEGFLGFWVSTSVLAVSVHWCSAEYPLWPALAASPVAGLAELLLARWDDNWVVPAAAAAAMLAAGAVGSFFS